MPLQDAWGLTTMWVHPRLVPSRVGESKILRYSERAYPLGCISARSRLGPPTTYTHGDVADVATLIEGRTTSPQPCWCRGLSQTPVGNRSVTRKRLKPDDNWFANNLSSSVS